MSELLVLRRPRPPAIVPPLLSFTAGFIDSFTVLALFGLFVAQVTGSFVLAAAAIVTNEQGALTKLLAIPVFLLAAVTTTILAVMLERRGRAALTWVLGLECAVYDAARARFGALFAIMLGFLVGTVFGALAYVAIGAWGLLLPLAIMYAILAWASARPLAQD